MEHTVYKRNKIWVKSLVWVFEMIFWIFFMKIVVVDKIHVVFFWVLVEKKMKLLKNEKEDEGD